jgi:hypothetical protein
MVGEAVTSSDIDALIRRAEVERGRVVGQRELLLKTMFNVALAFIDLETIRPRMMNNKISVIFRSAQDRTLQAKAEITVPTE